ncbi:chloride channel protein [Streptomyces sp. S.PB5]|uniref:chloride channel protein n=1 Tax=Streptomyces sp. S.PB5 TaxID=3020844 RepID=UPI0025AF26B0|nr:chloride channel protein [Streptomyces sp. S.PB5]MDN3026290.1 chloride channel protein [Streptomyces sp. S.PB5]
MAQDSVQQAPAAPATPARALLPLVLPALAVGVGASLLFLGVSAAAEALQDVLWQNLPDALGVGRYSALWIIVMLTATGAAVGLVVWKVPGHAGPDPATTGLDAPVLPPAVLPGLLLAAFVIASAAALLGMGAVRAFPYVHGGFSRLRHPMLALPVGGLVLGLLGALGGHLTLFKGLDEVGEIAADPDGWSAGEFATMTVVKLAALLVAASCGFRGGRIFPAVFVGAAFGLCAHALVPAVHPALGVAAGVLGMLLAITRQGWVSLFTAAVLVSSPAILALLCIASLPAWLLVTGRPQMQLREDGTAVR